MRNLIFTATILRLDSPVHCTRLRVAIGPYIVHAPGILRNFLSNLRRVAIFTAFLFFTVFLSSPAAAQEAAFNEQQALDEIWDAIEGETRCFFARDYECWKQHWVNESHAFQAWNNADGSSDASVGWQAIDEQVGNYIKEHPLNGAESSHPIVRRKEPTVKFYGPNCAYLTWKQYNSNRENTSFHLSHEARIMERVDGRWKIAMVAAFWDSTTTIPIDSLKD